MQVLALDRTPTIVLVRSPSPDRGLGLQWSRSSEVRTGRGRLPATFAISHGRRVSSAPLGEFRVATIFTPFRVLVAPFGEVDVATASDLGGILQGAIAKSSGREVVLDLSQCTFFDAAGLGDIAVAAAQLLQLHRSDLLIIHAPSPLVRRILTITGLDQVVRIEEEAAPAPSGPVEVDPGMHVGVAIHAATSADVPTTVSAIPADRDILDGALRLVVALTRASVRGADGVSVSLRRHGRLSTVAASNGTILTMDADQYATGEGPCVAASIEGRQFHAASLEAETRWPEFVPKARGLGINAILSNPLLVEDRPIGALNIYSNSSNAFGVEDERLASVFAAEASMVLTEAGASVTDEQLARRLVDALASRDTISLAQGFIMKRDGVSAEEAYRSLVDSSRQSNRPIRALSADIVARSPGAAPPGAAPLVEHRG